MSVIQLYFVSERCASIRIHLHMKSPIGGSLGSMLSVGVGVNCENLFSDRGWCIRSCLRVGLNLFWIKYISLLNYKRLRHDDQPHSGEVSVYRRALLAVA